MEYRISRYSTLAVEVDIDLPTSTKIPKHPSPIELIGLLFTLRHRRNHFQVSENDEQRLVEQREIPKISLCDHQITAEMFNVGNDSLFQYLSYSFENYQPEIDAELVVDALIELWIEIRDQVNSRSCEKVFSMMVNLTITDVVARHEIGIGSNVLEWFEHAAKQLKKLLKRLEIGDEDERICVG